MKIYHFYTGFDGDDSSHFTSLKYARWEAQEIADHHGIDVEIEVADLVPLTKANVIDILNSRGGRWAIGSRVVETVKPRKKSGE